jgi:hypothetical protein
VIVLCLALVIIIFGVLQGGDSTAYYHFSTFEDVENQTRWYLGLPSAERAREELRYSLCCWCWCCCYCCCGTCRVGHAE